MVRNPPRTGRDVRILLLHGAWHGGWAWDPVRERLEAGGHEVVAPDLPGSGADPAGWAGATPEAAARAVLPLIDGPTIVIAHSMGGMVAAALAELAPERLAAAGYLAAYLPADGERLNDLARLDPESRIGEAMVPLPDTRDAIALDPARYREILAPDAPPGAAERAAARVVPQATAMFRTPVTLTPARFGTVQSYYFRCGRDQVVTPALQDRMIARVPGIRVTAADCDHAPTLSDPASVAGWIGRIAHG